MSVPWIFVFLTVSPPDSLLTFANGTGAWPPAYSQSGDNVIKITFFNGTTWVLSRHRQNQWQPLSHLSHLSICCKHTSQDRLFQKRNQLRNDLSIIIYNDPSFGWQLTNDSKNDTLHMCIYTLQIIHDYAFDNEHIILRYLTVICKFCSLLLKCLSNILITFMILQAARLAGWLQISFKCMNAISHMFFVSCVYKVECLMRATWELWLKTALSTFPIKRHAC